MAIRKEEAFVLKRIPFRETSLFVTLFTREGVKIRGLAKGIRKEKKPLTIRFEPFTRLSVVYYEKLRSDTHLISNTDILNSNAYLRNNLSLFSYSSYFTELIDALIGVHDPHPETFELLDSAFKLIKTEPPAQVARVFEIKLLEGIGLLPILDHCVQCGENQFEGVFFSPKQGGIVCPRCDSRETATIRISKGAIQSLLFFLKNEPKRSVSLLSTPQIVKELELINSRFIQYRLERPLATKHFLAELATARH